jgi:hypothetical protein
MAVPEDQVEYCLREHLARFLLKEAIGTGYEFPADRSLVDEAESVMRDPPPRATKAVYLADRIIEIMKSKRRTWPAGFLPS